MATSDNYYAVDQHGTIIDINDLQLISLPDHEFAYFADRIDAPQRRRWSEDYGVALTNVIDTHPNLSRIPRGSEGRGDRMDRENR